MNKISFLKIVAGVTIFADILFVDKSIAIFELLILLLIVVIFKNRKYKYSFSFKIFGTFLVLTPALLILGFENVAEKAAIWTYMFLVVGTVQFLLNLREEATKANKYS